MSKRTGAVNHTHKYFFDTRMKVWTCGDTEEDCTHYRPRNMVQPIGISSICWVCGRPVKLLREHMDYTHPTHVACGEYDPNAMDMDTLRKYIDHMESRKKEEDQIEVIEGDENE